MGRGEAKEGLRKMGTEQKAIKRLLVTLERAVSVEL